MINATALGVYWNEGHRIGPLVARLATHFSHVTVVVQKSNDDTLPACQAILTGDTHKVIEDEWRGGGDFSMPLALENVDTEWVFVISGDEWPDDSLLASLPDAIKACEDGGYGGAFIKFRETIDDVEYVEHGHHVRLFRKDGGWEARHHSAASHENLLPTVWPTGNIIHTRTLDEFYGDYLRKLTMMEAEGEDRLAAHNRYVLFAVSNLIALEKGWRYVWGRPQWSEVERRVFTHIESPMAIV